MKVSWRWLSEMADLAGVPVEEAVRLLPLRVADVEGVERLGALDGVVTARVLEVEPHPNADRLRLCTVEHGASTIQRVVCGAPNVAKGQVVCFARVGTTLPNGLTLKKAKIRGVDSEGMICAEDELGIGTDHAGIIVLPEGTPVGKPAADALGIADVVIELNNTGITNRPDLWGHAGVAREVAAVFGKPLSLPGAPRAEAAVAAATGTPFPVEVEDAEGCRRYLALVLEGVHDGPSPAPIRRRLETLGLRSVSLLVDLTNLAMLERGQPLHAFDVRRVRGGTIRVRRARAGEHLVTLDGKDLALDPEDLVIADAEGPLALAGVIGGRDSGVAADTTSIVLEAACFDPARVRRSAIRHGIRTDASARFEKSLDPEGVRPAALRFLEGLLGVIPGARVARPPTDVYPRRPAPAAIDLSFDLVRRRLGWPVEDAAIARRLESVGFRCEPRPGGLRAHVPSWRATKDVSIPEDLVEEVGRLEGYEHVVPSMPVAPMAPHEARTDRLLDRDGRAALCLDLGYAEIATYAFHGAEDARRLGIDPETLLRLAHPISADQDRMQATTARNLLVAAAKNQVREPVLRLAEWSRVFAPRSKDGAGLPSEIPVVGALLADRERKDDPRGETFLSLKEDLVRWLARLGVPDVVVLDAGDARLDPRLAPPAWLHPGRRAALSSGGRLLGIVGEVLPAVARAFGLVGRVAVGEVRTDAVLAGGRPGVPYRAVPRFPEAPFDVAVVVPRKTPAAEVAKVLRASTPGAVRDVALFDVYEGAGIPEGSRSLAWTVTFGAADGTLESKAIERLQGRAIEALRRAGWTVRTNEAPPKA